MNSYNITGYCGSTLLLTLSCTNSDGTYLNLSGYGLRGGVKSQFSSTSYAFNLNPTIISAVSGSVQLSGNSVVLSGVKPNIYNYDVEAYNSGDYVFKILRGYMFLFPETTNI